MQRQRASSIHGRGETHVLLSTWVRAAIDIFVMAITLALFNLIEFEVVAVELDLERAAVSCNRKGAPVQWTRGSRGLLSRLVVVSSLESTTLLRLRSFMAL
jgi:hypothetical protein